MMWYEWTQNNSGGSFVVDDKLTHRLYIEADSYKKAKKIAKSLGVYHNGVDKGWDCSCCGDRWCPGDLVEFPHYTGLETIEEIAQYYADTYGWEEPDARLFYQDGKVKEIFGRKRKRKFYSKKDTNDR